ncbi:3799_t:CDS:2 [Entrophospora sp. SA101]|nr:3799_t:CDS:2 [Entrophospora sp. SA101]
MSVEADVIKADPLLRTNDGLHVDEEYAIDFNKTYSNNAMRHCLLKTGSNDNISYPSHDFMMLSATTSVRKEGYGIIDTMVVDHDNGGFLVNNVIQLNLKANGSLSWSIQGMWLQPHISFHSTNLMMISWKNGTDFQSDWIGYVVINNTDINSLGINPIGDQGQSTDLPTRSIMYGVEFNDTLSLDAEIWCEGYTGIDNISENIVGVNCWTLLGFLIQTTQGTEQTFYSCASAVEASVKTIKLQSSTTGAFNVTDVQTIPAQCKQKYSNLLGSSNNIWGFNYDANAASAPAMAMDKIRSLKNDKTGYHGDAKIVGTVQFTMEKTCYDPRFAIQYFVAMIGLIIIFCILLASLMSVSSFNSLTKIRLVVRQMDFGRAILNAQGYGEASIVGSPKWIKIDDISKSSQETCFKNDFIDVIFL